MCDGGVCWLSLSLFPQVYRQLGAFEQGINLHNALEVKQIQLETLSWLLFPGCVDTGLYNEAHSRASHLILFHRASSRDASDFFVKSLTMGTYTKALEIDAFQVNKMGRSLQLALAKAELSWMELLLKAPTLETAVVYLRSWVMGMEAESMEMNDGEVDALCDNMDHAVLRSWDYQPPHQHEEDVRGVKTRHISR